MIKYLIILSLLLLGHQYTVAQQNGAAATRDPDIIRFGCCNISKYDIIDTTDYVLVYNMAVIADTVKNKRFSGQVVLQIGSNWTKFYGKYAHCRDLGFTRNDEGQRDRTLEEKEACAGSGDEVAPYEIICDLHSSRLINIHHIPWTYNKLIKYEENKPDFAWKILDQEKDILNHRCFAATSEYAGRQWRAWFTPEIPINLGPWKFSGLPGLILMVYDTRQHYVFECLEIHKDQKEIRRYKVPTSIITKEQWRKYDRNGHRMPNKIYGNNGAMEFYYYNNGKMNLLDDSWSIPYNPIEME